MNHSKLSTFTIILLTLTLAISACQPQAVLTDENTDLRIWGFYDLTNTEDSRAVQLQQIIADFQETTNIIVDYEQVAYDQMATKVSLSSQAGGDLPDLIMINYVYLQGLINSGALLNINDQISSSDFYADLIPFEKELNEFNGNRYAVGSFISGGQWYYDTSIFPDGLPDTEEGWKAACSRLSAEGKYVATFFAGRSAIAMAHGFSPLVWSLGSTLFDNEGKPDFANPHVAHAITFWRELLAEKCIPEIAFTGDWSAAEVPFINQQAGAVRGGTWSYIYITGLQERFDSGQVKIGNPPALSGGEQGYVFMNPEAWAVISQANNAPDAFKFINFFYTPEILAPWAMANFGIPATASAMEDPTFQNHFYQDTLDNLMRNGHASESSPYFNESMESLAAMVQELILRPDLDVMEQLTRLQTELETVYFFDQ